MKLLIGGGGTGGHVFPAIAIAQAVKAAAPDTQILFVGAKDKIEMEKVPAAGFDIIGLPAAGIQRKLSIKNISLAFKLVVCMVKSRRIIRQFKPDVAIGVGGYASGPILRAASKAGVPIFIQEQNGHAGVTNKLLASRAVKIFTAYHNMDKYFTKEKTVFTGNPVRSDILDCKASKEEALQHFGLTNDKLTVLSVGGSLGAGTINKAVFNALDKFKQRGDVQVIWQTGKFYFDEIDSKLKNADYPFLKYSAFIKRMDLAYRAADVVVSRSGALSVSELCLAGKPVIFIPSPNVAEDHQTKNAMALVNENAAELLTDARASEKLFEMVSQLLDDSQKRDTFSKNISKLAMPDSAFIIAREIINFAKR